MRVVVYEPDPTGHHLAYVSRVVEPLASLASELILLTSQWAADSPQFAQHRGRFSTHLTVDTGIGDPARRLAIRPLMRQFASLRRAAKRLRPDHLYVASGDYFIEMAALHEMAGRCWPDATEAEVLLLRGGYQYPASRLARRMRRRVSPWLLRRGPWNRIHHINPDDLEVIRGNDVGTTGRFSLMPDPVEPPSQLTKGEARRLMNVPEDGRYIGCVGGINRAKGVDRLISAFRAARADLQSGDRLLLAGPIDEELRSFISSGCGDDLASGRLVIIDRLLSSDEIATAVAATDVVATPYPWHVHSSSIVIRAAAGGRPVVGNFIGWMKRTIPQFQLGAVCDVGNEVALRRTLVRTLDESGGYQLTSAARRFVAFHSAENFARHWIKRLRQRVGLPEDPALISWAYVIGGGR
jgi:glycosyltransferase involved in cell wall biosynthesis